MFGLTDEQLKLIQYQNNGKVPVDQVFNINYDTQLWAAIPGFNGYQLSGDYTIRSYKFYKKYPYGTLLLPKKGDGTSMDDIYELTDNDNMRIEISPFELGKLVHAKPLDIYHTNYRIPSNKTPRNSRIFINQDPELTAKKKGLVKKSVPVNREETTRMVKFTVTNNPKPLDDYK